MIYFNMHFLMQNLCVYVSVLETVTFAFFFPSKKHVISA